MAKSKSKSKSVPDDVRDRVIEECARCVPTNWCDALLTGPGAPTTPLDNRGVEQLLLGVQDRIRSLQSSDQ